MVWCELVFPAWVSCWFNFLLFVLIWDLVSNLASRVYVFCELITFLLGIFFVTSEIFVIPLLDTPEIPRFNVFLVERLIIC